MTAYFDEQVRDNCWNLYDSYGEICVHCGCCAKDKATQYKARIECLKCWLAEKEAFNGWDDSPAFRAVQESNIKQDIKAYKRQIRYYEKKLREVMENG